MREVDKRVEDQDSRDEAIDITRSFIVRAPAGSGKTTLLIQRYLALLAKVDEPEEIIAITFTRKAAAEMRERLLAAFAGVDRAAGEIDATTVRLAHAAQARDAQCAWHLAANASRLRIQTIDSLNASITRQMPLAARFGAQPEIIDDAGALYREAARAVLAEVNAGGPLATDVGALLTHLDNNLSVAENLLAEMLRARDHWLRNLPRMNVREMLEAALARVRANAIAEVARRFPAAEKEETLALARFAGLNIPENRTSAGDSTLILIAEWPDTTDTSLPAWLAIADLLLTKTGTWRKRGGLNKNSGFPADRKQQKARMGDLLDRIDSGNDRSRLADSLDRLRALPPARYSETQWEVLGAIVRLLPQATAMLWAVFSAHGQCDFTEIALAASRALGAEDEPTDLALALDYRIGHILVDEFQDTSVEQFGLLEKLSRGWSAGDGRTLFLVGDPMQSIYRFRKAEVGLFRQAADRGIGTIVLKALQLTVNFRSQPGIIEWVNETFTLLMPGNDDTGDSGVSYTRSVAAAGVAEPNHLAVTWYPQVLRKNEADADEANANDAHVAATDDAEEEEARRIVAIIGATPTEKSIALLVRNRGHLAAVVPALKKAGIAFRAVDIDPLKERPVVLDLLALTRALLHPADRIAWLAVLRAGWCGLTLNDLAVLAGGVPADDTALIPDTRPLWEIINDDARLALLSEDGRARLTLLREVIASALAAGRRVPLRELVERVWLALRGPACLSEDGDLDDAEQLLELLEAEADAQTGGSHIVDLAQLDARVDRLFAGNRAADGNDRSIVQIMTIHKAKGLEFDTVIVPALHRVPRHDDKRLLIWAERVTPGTSLRELLLAPIRETGADEATDAIYRFVQQYEKAKQREEDVRLLYVAATRAKRRLYLLGTATVKDNKGDERPAAPRAGSLLASLWPAAAAAFANAMAAPIVVPAPVLGSAALRPARSATRLVGSQTLPQMPAAIFVVDGKPVTTQSAAIDFEWAGVTARHVGTVVHAFLQRMAEDGLPHWDRERIAASAPSIATELARHGVAADEISAATLRVVDALMNTIADARGRWTLQMHGQARAEWRLTGMLDGALVNIAIDRTFVDDDNVRWIIDFKTGSHDGADVDGFLDNERMRYSAQLESYARILNAMETGPQVTKIQLGLYFPMLMGWRAWEWKKDRNDD